MIPNDAKCTVSLPSWIYGCVTNLEADPDLGGSRPKTHSLELGKQRKALQHHSQAAHVI